MDAPPPAFEISRSSVMAEPVAHPVVAEAAEEEPEPEAAETEAELHYEEPPMAAAAHANGASDPLFDDLDVPAILKRDRRFVQ